MQFVKKKRLSNFSKRNSMIPFILNLPYTLIGFIAALISVPTSVKFHEKPYAIIFTVKTFKWRFWTHLVPRAFTVGNTVVLGRHIEEHDLEHELIHVRQNTQFPLIYPLFYYYETFKHGYRKNKFEDEAYRLSGSVYRHGKNLPN